MPDKKIWRQFLKVSCGDLMIILCRGRFCWIWYQKVFDSIREAPFWNVFFPYGQLGIACKGWGGVLGLARMVRGTSIIALLCACHLLAHVHSRATHTRAWCGHAHAHGNATRMRVATNRAGILLAIMRPGQLKRGCPPPLKSTMIYSRGRSMQERHFLYVPSPCSL